MSEAAPETPAAPDVEVDAETPAQEIDWKAEARKHERRAKEYKAKLDDAAPKLDEYNQLIEASKSDMDKAREEASRLQAENEQWRTAAVAAKAEALAAADFEYPDLAVAKLDLAQYLDLSGQINENAIKTDLRKILADYPKLGRSEPGPRTPAPNRAQGAGGQAPADPRAEFAAIFQGATQ